MDPTRVTNFPHFFQQIKKITLAQKGLVCPNEKIRIPTHRQIFTLFIANATPTNTRHNNIPVTIMFEAII